jgi:hypothetical protein
MLYALRDLEITQLASVSTYAQKVITPLPTPKPNCVLLYARQDIFLTMPLAHVYLLSIAPAHSSATHSTCNVSAAKTVLLVTSSTIHYFYASEDAPLDNMPILTQESAAHHALGILQLTSRLRTIQQDDVYKNAQQTQGLSATTLPNHVSMCVPIPILEVP